MENQNKNAADKVAANIAVWPRGAREAPVPGLVDRKIPHMLRVVVLDQHGEAAGVDLGVLAEGFLGNQMASHETSFGP